MPFGTDLVLLRSAPPIIATLRPWTKRADAAQLAAGREAFEATVRSGASTAAASGDAVPDEVGDHVDERADDAAA
ncbi:hypothetical protein [Promicromonospora aerolata]|uniref:Uncharacterized protein n=1 Tax=Promicromonospora aerolata TaxID=195749 RepID=A0ABW4VBU5_9MICO